MVLAAIGLACLGLVICYICMFFLARFKEHSVSALSGVVLVLLGGVVGKFITDNTEHENAIWWYPIGAAVGLVLWIIVRGWDDATGSINVRALK